MASKMICIMLDVQTQLERNAVIQKLTEEEQHAHKNLHNGKTEEEIRELLMTVFQQADMDGSGVLSYSTTKSCLESVGLFSQKEINGLLSLLTDDTHYEDVAMFAFPTVRHMAKHA